MLVKLHGLLRPLDADSAHTKVPSRFLSFTKVPFLEGKPLQSSNSKTSPLY